MSSPVPALSHVEAVVATHLAQLRPAQQRGLALWVVALLVARSGCERAILTALAPVGFAEHALRARLREWLYDGADRAAPCATACDGAGRDELLCSRAAVGAGLVGRSRPAPGHRYHHLARALGGPEHQRALSGCGHPGRVVRGAVRGTGQ